MKHTLLRPFAYLFVALALGCVFSTTAYAASDKKPTEEEERNVRDVELPTIVVPISVDGKLVNYVFVVMKVTVGPSYDPWKIRDKVHVARDALIRAVHRTPMTNPNNLKDFDRTKVSTILKPALEKAFGPGSVAAIKVIQVDSIKQVVKAPKAAR